MEKKRRAGGRSGNTRRSSHNLIEQMPWRQPIINDPPIEPLDEQGVLNIHNGAMTILEDIGIEFLNPEALTILKNAGCKVTDQNVKMGRDFVMEKMKTAPEMIDITPRNPERVIKLGGNNLAFLNVSSPPNIWDLKRGKRPGDFEGFKDLVKLTQYFNCLHGCAGYPVEPIDIHPSTRHLDCLYEKLTLTDKVVHAYSLGKDRVEDVMEMVRIAGGLSHEEFNSKSRMYTNINSVSPLKHDFPMLEGAMIHARRNQAVVVTPFTLAGAMAPVTMSGAVTLSIAEGLAALVLLQIINPGCPVMIGTFTSNVDMKSGAPAFGTPEYMRATQMTGQMARFYKIPMRSSGVCTSNIPDGQAMWETSNSLWSAVHSGTNLVYHAAGWLEGGLIASPEKLVMDCEVLQMIQRYCDAEITKTRPQDIAIDAIKTVGSDGHYFGVEHTQERYETAFYSPIASDWSNYEAWNLNGANWTAERAHRIYKNIINEFIPPPIDPSIKDELKEFVHKRKNEGGVATDF